MLATLRRSLPADQDRYGWEFKWDGVRAIAYVSGSEVRLVAPDKDMAASYRELAVLAGRVGAPVILDGEIVALRAGRPDFGALQSRMHVRRPPSRLIDGTSAQLYLFDLLHHGQDSLLGPPYTERRDRLEELGPAVRPAGLAPPLPPGTDTGNSPPTTTTLAPDPDGTGRGQETPRPETLRAWEALERAIIEETIF